MAAIAERVATSGVFKGAQRARWATVRIETQTTTYVGRVYVPETKQRLSDVLCDDRPFLSVTEVSIDGAESTEPFVALNKRYVKAVRVLDEGDVEVVAVPRTH